MFSWFLLFFLTITNLAEIVIWSYRLLNKNSRTQFINDKLSTDLKNDSDDKFILNYLNNDGILAIRLLSENSNNTFASVILEKLYKNFKNNEIDSHQTQPLLNNSTTSIDRVNPLSISIRSIDE